MKTKLMLGQAILFLTAVTFFSVILVQEKGGILFYPYIDKKITSYYEEHYSSLTGIKKGKLEYNKKEKSYFITYSNSKRKELNFQITYKKKKIKSNYKKSYQEGESLLSMQKQKIEKKVQTIFEDTDFSLQEVSFYPLNKYVKQEQDIIIKEKDLKASGLYTLSIDKKTNDFLKTDADLLLLSSLLEKEKIVPEKISLTLKTKEESRTITLGKGEDNIWKIVYSAKS